MIVSSALLTFAARAEVFLTEGTNISVDTASDGRLATDILGGVWVVPSDGGEATAVATGLRPARRPRWSPDDAFLVYESSTAERNAVWLYDFDRNSTRPLGKSHFSDQHPDWHPDGERVVFSSERRGSGLDIWEIDVATELTFRLTDLPGDEYEPAWSDDGRSLAYVYEHEDRWSIMLRRRGRADEELVSSDEPLRAPSWRPDRSLITYLRHSDAGWQVWMTVLAEPRLHRPLIMDEDFFLAPVAWLDRQRMVYAADGHLRLRRFNSWTSTNLPFRARVGTSNGYGQATVKPRELPSIEEPSGRTVIRAGRLFDGLSEGYLANQDIVIDGGRIAAIEGQQAREDAIVVDLGDVTVLPGYIDAYAAVPDSVAIADGPLLLSLGVTTLVAAHDRHEELSTVWSGKQVPGPRLLPAAPIDEVADDGALPWLITVSGDMTAGAARRDEVQDWQTRGVAVLADGWQVGLGSGASLLVGTDSRPTSPGGRRYQDVQLASGAGAITFVSGLADAMTPGINAIYRSRQAEVLGPLPELTRRFTATPLLDQAAGTMVLGSKPNGLPTGLATHAEFRALVAAGLSETQALKAAGVNAATALGFGLRLGRIAPGAAADLVIVDGDPLARIGDTLRIVGVVRNGRFFSVSGLLDRAYAARTVE